MTQKHKMKGFGGFAQSPDLTRDLKHFHHAIVYKNGMMRSRFPTPNSPLLGVGVAFSHKGNCQIALKIKSF